MPMTRPTAALEGVGVLLPEDILRPPPRAWVSDIP